MEEKIGEISINEKTVSIVSEEDDGLAITVDFPDGKKYRIQHPGNRVYLKLREDSLRLGKGTFSLTHIIEAMFKSYVTPVGHDTKPNLDNIPPKYLGVWERLLDRFLEGTLY